LNFDISNSNFKLFEDYYKIFQQNTSLKDEVTRNTKYKQSSTFKDFSQALTIANEQVEQHKKNIFQKQKVNKS